MRLNNVLGLGGVVSTSIPTGGGGRKGGREGGRQRRGRGERKGERRERERRERGQRKERKYTQYNIWHTILVPFQNSYSASHRKHRPHNYNIHTLSTQ
jgi:phage tail tape-measure protein